MKTQKQKIVELMSSINANLYSIGDIGVSYHFTTPLRDNDRTAVTERIKPNHFIPKNYRTIHIMKHWQGGWYITSNLYGEWRGYKCRNTYEMRFGNFFVYDDNIIECVKKFISVYNNLEYNTGK